MRAHSIANQKSIRQKGTCRARLVLLFPPSPHIFPIPKHIIPRSYIPYYSLFSGTRLRLWEQYGKEF